MWVGGGYRKRVREGGAGRHEAGVVTAWPYMASGPAVYTFIRPPGTAFSGC